MGCTSPLVVVASLFICNAHRICVGKYLAEASVWIAMVSILAVFNVNKAKDERGREIDVVPQYTPGVIM